MITVHPINAHYIRLVGPFSELFEIEQHFSPFAENYKFLPKFKQGKWDGKIRFLNKKTGLFPAGLITDLLKVPNLTYQLTPGVWDNQSPNQTEIKKNADYIKALKVPWIPYDYQVDCAAANIERKRRLIISPTGSGKSLIIYFLIRLFLQKNPNQKVLLVVPVISLVEQMSSDLIQYSYDELKPLITGIHSQSKDQQTDHQQIVISTWQSIYRKPEDYFKQFRMIIGDEAHRFNATSLTNLAKKCTSADYRYGLTGTINRTDISKITLQSCFGPIEPLTTTRELIDTQTLAQLTIHIIRLQHKHPELPSMAGNNKTKKYHHEINYLCQHPKRNQFIAKLALSINNGNTLILFRLVKKHGKVLEQLITDLNDQCDRKILFVSGSTPAEDREEVRAIVEKEKNAIIIASIGTFSTGINIKEIHNLIFAAPSKSQIQVLQSIGRALRKSEMQDTTVYDIADRFGENKYNYTYLHMLERKKIYDENKFSYASYEVGID